MLSLLKSHTFRIFIKHSLGAYKIPGTVLGSRDTDNKRDNISHPLGVYILAPGETKAGRTERKRGSGCKEQPWNMKETYSGQGKWETHWSCKFYTKTVSRVSWITWDIYLQFTSLGHFQEWDLKISILNSFPQGRWFWWAEKFETIFHRKYPEGEAEFEVLLGLLNSRAKTAENPNTWSKTVCKSNSQWPWYQFSWTHFIQKKDAWKQMVKKKWHQLANCFCFLDPKHQWSLFSCLNSTSPCELAWANGQPPRKPSAFLIRMPASRIVSFTWKQCIEQRKERKPMFAYPPKTEGSKKEPDS